VRRGAGWCGFASVAPPDTNLVNYGAPARTPSRSANTLEGDDEYGHVDCGRAGIRARSERRACAGGHRDRHLHCQRQGNETPAQLDFPFGLQGATKAGNVHPVVAEIDARKKVVNTMLYDKAFGSDLASVAGASNKFEGAIDKNAATGNCIDLRRGTPTRSRMTSR
jgi:hypothetical protein